MIGQNYLLLSKLDLQNTNYFAVDVNHIVVDLQW